MQEPDARTKRWAQESLAKLLQMPEDTGEIEMIVENILAYDDPDELKDFLSAFAEATAEHKVHNFIEELFQRRLGTAPGGDRDKGGGKGKAAVESGKGDSGGKGGSSSSGGGGKGRGKEQEAARPKAKQQQQRPRPAEPGKEDFPKLDMPMRPREYGDKRMIVIDAASGRHKVLTNCLNCGKVIVEQEGWGPCLFCGNPLDVTHAGDAYRVRSGDDRGFMEPVGKAQTQEEAAYYEKVNSSFQKAVATKDRLLSYDRDAKKRTKVYDDATDWYSESINPWLSQRQREEAVEKSKEEERRAREEKRKIHAKIDLVGRTVISTDADVAEDLKRQNKENFEAWNEQVADQIRLRSMYQQEQGVGSNNHLSEESKQLYEKLRASVTASSKNSDASKFSPETAQSAGKANKARWEAKESDRVEDDILTVTEGAFAKSSAPAQKLLPVEESPYADSDDTGQCLSMWQPWASLLIYGFKRAEGRSWSSKHRGRLWIHAASRQPDEMEIQELEAKYASLYESFGVPTPPLPSASGGYPTSALLGCVDVEANWSKDEYQAILDATPSMPPEENGSEFIFWCLRPRKLAIPIKMGGDNKIWTIPKAQLQAAQRGLQPMRWPAPEAGQGRLVSPEVPRSEAPPAAAASSSSSSAAPAGSKGGAAPEKGGAASSGKAETAGGAASSSASAAAAAAAGRKAPPQSGPPAFDLWPAEKPEDLVVLEKDGVDRDIVVLQDGFVQLCGFVPLDVQQRIIDTLRETGISESGFFAEQFDGIKVSTGAMRMYLGSHWNAVSKQWEPSRGNINGASVAAIPKELSDLYVAAVARANRELNNARNKKRKFQTLPEGKAGLAVVNFLPNSSTMQLHQDTQESKASITAGYPVVGICIGEACEFSYSMETPGGAQKPKVVRMESGDVYLFGGPSRMLWHGITRIVPRTAPPSLRLQTGRLSITLRVP